MIIWIGLVQFFLNLGEWVDPNKLFAVLLLALAITWSMS